MDDNVLTAYSILQFYAKNAVQCRIAYPMLQICTVIPGFDLHVDAVQNIAAICRVNRSVCM